MVKVVDLFGNSRAVTWVEGVCEPGGDGEIGSFGKKRHYVTARESTG